MRAPTHNLGRVGATLVVGTVLFLVSCVTATRPQQFRTFFVPPARTVVPPDDSPIEPPRLRLNLYTTEAPTLTTSLPSLPRPSDVDFLIKTADDRFAAGKRAFQEGRFDDARREFNRSIETLLSAPEKVPERARLERRLEELVEAIYRYDVDPLGVGEADDQVSFDKSPLDSILEMTFPVDPSLRNKVREQIQATASQLPLEASDAVISYINFFSTTRGKKILTAGLRRSGHYKPLIERVLAAEGIPQELIFVAQAESGFLPRAISNKKCVGLWQFAQFRGREYGLNQTASTDDRMDPERATRAAARHLRDLYTHFGDWYLALAAYNCGPGCIDRAVMRTGYADFWTLRRLNVLPKETANYVPVILAMTIMSKNAKDYGLDGIESDNPLEYDTLELQTATHLALIADAVDRPLGELRELNPAVLKATVPAGYPLRIPKGTQAVVEQALSVVPANRRDSWRLHRVEQGDTLAGIAKRYSTAAALISSANHDELPGAGEWMAIPVAYPGDRTSQRSPAKIAPGVRKTASAATSRATQGKTLRKRPATVARRATTKGTAHRISTARTPPA
jgi:membrane-bound lytic murein transglycosylase D